jgi:hypothetical protein
MRFLRLMLVPTLLGACGLLAAGCESSKPSAPVTVPDNTKWDTKTVPTPPPMPFDPKNPNKPKP